MNRRHAHKAYTGVGGGRDTCFCFLLRFRTAFHEGNSGSRYDRRLLFPNNITAGETSDHSGAKSVDSRENGFVFFLSRVHGAGYERG